MKSLLMMISLICCFAVYSQGQLAIIPEPYDRALKNPMMGFSPNNLGNHPWGTLSTFKFPWTVLEEHESDGPSSFHEHLSKLKSRKWEEH